MDEALRRTVVERANRACEYCHLPETISFLPFQFDHIIAQKHHGITDESNLAWVCYYCNSYKGPNIAGQDRLTSTIVRLFHPRQDVWESHFEWQNAVLLGRTAIGRVTIDVLNINREEAVAVRRWAMARGHRFK